jgi:hypothetical protein
MFKLPKIVLPSVAAGLFAAAALAGAASPAAADSWGRDSWRCFGDRCARFHCDWDGDRCERTSEWRWRGGYRDGGYRYGEGGYGYRDGGGRTVQRCWGDRCVTVRCDHDGDRCERADGWRWR